MVARGLARAIAAGTASHSGHGKHLAAAYTFVDRYPILANAGHRTVAYLPLCHVMGRIIAISLPLLTQIVPHYGEDLDDLPETMFEVAPTVLMFVPRYLQKYAAQILVGIQNSSRFMSKAGSRNTGISAKVSHAD